ncbi:MAG: hypothetical protein JNJ49_17755 [Bdellovibrionaceae bacterium]|nr:hypothetical protein [Pseudobdellovibrionaceae bacterium]
MKNLTRRLSVFALIFSVGFTPTLGVADVVQTPAAAQERSRFQWTFGLMLGAITVGGIYGLSTMEGGNNYIGALYLLPAIASAESPHSNHPPSWNRWPGIIMQGSFAALSILNFFAWKNENVSRQQLFTNNMIGLTASIAIPVLVWNIGQNSDTAQVFFIPNQSGSQLAIHLPL